MMSEARQEKEAEGRPRRFWLHDNRSTGHGGASRDPGSRRVISLFILDATNLAILFFLLQLLIVVDRPQHPSGRRSWRKADQQEEQQGSTFVNNEGALKREDVRKDSGYLDDATHSMSRDVPYNDRRLSPRNTRPFSRPHQRQWVSRSFRESSSERDTSSVWTHDKFLETYASPDDQLGSSKVRLSSISITLDQETYFSLIHSSIG